MAGQTATVSPTRMNLHIRHPHRRYGINMELCVSISGFACRF